MYKPKMVFFDYGRTILRESGYDNLRGTQVLMEYATSNPYNWSPKQVNDFAACLWQRVCAPARALGYELPNSRFCKLLYSLLQIEFCLTPSQQEQIFWDNVSPGAVTPHITNLLEYLSKNGIRTGVISNLSFSGESLQSRVKQLLPNSAFEFFIASSDYLMRKPHPLIFTLALAKAGLTAGEVWHCGDDPVKDVAGAAAAGIFPIWYKSSPYDEPLGLPRKPPKCPHLAIEDWSELIDALQRLEPA